VPVVLICSAAELQHELAGTLLWRQDVERRLATEADEAQRMAEAGRPDLIVVDRDLPGVEQLVTALRRSAVTRRVSIVIMARDDFDPVEAALVACGANAVLRLPPDPEWDERLTRLMSVPTRKDVRLMVQFDVEARPGQGITSSLATALNLSLNGMLLECSFALQIGDDLDFRFELPGTDEPIVGCGRVVRRAGSSRYGIEFYGIEGDGADIVRWFVGDQTG
jgi:CheY-like chemotaxis protein